MRCTNPACNRPIDALLRSGHDRCVCEEPIGHLAPETMPAVPPGTDSTLDRDTSAGEGQRDGGAAAVISDSVVKSESIVGRDIRVEVGSGSPQAVPESHPEDAHRPAPDGGGDGAVFQDSVTRADEIVGRDKVVNIENYYVVYDRHGGKWQKRGQRPAGQPPPGLDTAAVDPLPGLTIELGDNFKSPELLRDGRRSYIVKATEVTPNRTVVLKISKKELSDCGDLKSSKEADAMARLNKSPFVVTIFATFGNILVMEYMAKGALADHFGAGGALNARWIAKMMQPKSDDGRPVSPTDGAIHIMESVARGVQDIHAAGLLHLDLSPNNILVDADNSIKVTDFGLARLAMAPSEKEAFANGRFDAPEQEKDERSDVYSLGLLYKAVLLGVSNPKVVDWAQADPPVSDLLTELVDSMTAASPAQRPTMDGVLDSLGELSRQRLPAKARPHVGRAAWAKKIQWHSFFDLKKEAKKRARQELQHLPPWATELVEQIDAQFGKSMPQWKSDCLLQNGYVPQWLRRPKGSGHWMRSFFGAAEASLARSWLVNGLMADDPHWYLELQLSREAKIARVFVLHGNINDYFFHPDEEQGYSLLTQFLERQLTEKVIFYSLSQGIKGSPPATLGDDSAKEARSESLWVKVKDDFGTLDAEVRSSSTRGTVVVVNYIDKLFPQGMAEIEREFLVEMILRWAVDGTLPAHNMVILTTTNYDSLHPDLKSRANRIRSIEVDRPGRKGRLKYLLSKAYSTQANARGGGRTGAYVGSLRFGSETGRSLIEHLQMFARITSGLNLMGIEDLILRAIHENNGLVEATDVARHKRSLLAGESAGLLEMVEPRYSFRDVGGLGGVLNRLKEICAALQIQDPRLRMTIPMGILFLGPPGTGKSLVAEAMAFESGLTFVKLGNFRDMYVGQTEKNMSLALQLIRSLTPIVVFIDEIDQAVMQRGGSSESGPEKRVFAKLLEFMSDQSLRGQVVWIGASNVPGEIDDALKRAGRFDLKLPFFLPAVEERRRIFEIKLQPDQLHMENCLSDEDLQQLAERAKGFSGAEIQVVINEALRMAVGEHLAGGGSGQPCLAMAHCEKVLAVYHPGDAIAKYRQIERQIVKDIPYVDLLPESYRSGEAPR